MKEKKPSLKQLTYIACLIIAIPALLAFGQDVVFVIIKKPVQVCINKEVLSVKKELDAQRHNDMVQISQLLMAIPEIREKAEKMKNEKSASITIIEALGGN